jgi:hypothetical protein
MTIPHRLRRLSLLWLAVLMAVTLAPGARPVPAAAAAQAGDTATPTPTSTATPTPTPTPTPTTTSEVPSATVFTRPLVILKSYGNDPVKPGQEFRLAFRLENRGGLKARNIVVTFSTGDFIPRTTGGVLDAGVIAPGASTWYEQPMTASPALTAGAIGTAQMAVNYTDDVGTAYSEAFSLSIPIGSPHSTGPAPTRTTTPGPRPQLLIQAYMTDVEILQPGARFTLSLDVLNVGGSTARRITLILGGGTSSSGQATPGAGSDGGVSGSGGDFSQFAPVGSSNLQYLGDLPAQQTLTAKQALIVSGAAQPGVHPLRVTFAYTDERGIDRSDDQVITLLVLSPPLLDINFYMPPDPLFVGQPGTLPVQVVNLGRNSLILGRLEVSAEGAEMVNASQLIGYLDPGAYFPLDAMAIALQPGPLNVLVTVHYLDDLNQPQTITQQLAVEVLEAPSAEGGGGFVSEEPVPFEAETFWQKLWRVVLGLLGLDSSSPQPAGPVIEEGLPSEVPVPAYPPPKG